MLLKYQYILFLVVAVLLMLALVPQIGFAAFPVAAFTKNGSEKYGDKSQLKLFKAFFSKEKGGFGKISLIAGLVSYLFIPLALIVSQVVYPVMLLSVILISAVIAFFFGIRGMNYRLRGLAIAGGILASMVLLGFLATFAATLFY